VVLLLLCGCLNLSFFGGSLMSFFFFRVALWVFSGPRAWSLWWSCVRGGEWSAVGYYGDVVFLSGWCPAWLVSLSEHLPARPASSDNSPVPF
jgi:hypothetical protein